MRKVFSLSNILGFAIFMDLLVAIPGTINNSPDVTAVLIVILVLLIYITMKEDGKIR